MLCPSWRWMTISGTPSRTISTAWAWRSWCGATRWRTPAAAAVRRSCVRAAAVAQGRPPVAPLLLKEVHGIDLTEGGPSPELMHKATL